MTFPNKKKLIKENLSNIHDRIKKGCEKYNRSPDEVRLMLVTKTVPAEVIQLAIDEGEKLLGENVIEELEKTYNAFHSGNNPEIHFIGHLTEADLDKVLAFADCVQTVDRMGLAQEMNKKLAALNQEKDILIQVNTSRQISPFGISPEHTIGLVLKIGKLNNLRIKGLMTLGLFDTTEEKARSCFQLLKNLFDEIKLLEIPGVQMEILSMGMSDHLEVAIEEGSTMVRVGTAIFGERKTPDSFYWSK